MYVTLRILIQVRERVERNWLQHILLNTLVLPEITARRKSHLVHQKRWFFPLCQRSTRILDWVLYFQAQPQVLRKTGKQLFAGSLFQSSSNVTNTNNWTESQVAKQLSTIADEKSGMKYLEEFRETMGVMQHHDAVTGTEKQKVADDYARLLHKSFVHADGIMEDSLRCVLMVFSLGKCDWRSILPQKVNQG